MCLFVSDVLKQLCDYKLGLICFCFFMSVLKIKLKTYLFLLVFCSKTYDLKTPEIST